MIIKIPTIKDELGDRMMKYCVYHPTKKAIQWTGYLQLGKCTAVGGYCSTECSSSTIGIPQGCLGSFKRIKQ